MRRVLLVVSSLVLYLATVPSTPAQSVAERLERGIYTEETAGDLKGALEIYRQIVEDASAMRPHVAEALFRIGMCHLKGGDPAAAAEAFQRIIAEYPEQESLALRARANMPDDPESLPLLPAPWIDGEVQRLSLRLTSGAEIGTLFLTADPIQVDEGEAWRLRVRRRIYSDADNQAVSEVIAYSDTLEPIRSTVKHSIIGHFEAEYGDGTIGIETVGTDNTREAEFTGQVFDNDQGFHLFRLLPLELGYKAKVKVFSPVAGAVTPVEIEVAEIETITVQAGEFECYRVDFSVPQTFWYSTGPDRRLVKLEASGIVGELEEVYQGDPKRSTPYADSTGGFSVTSPPGWLRAPFDDHGTPKVVMLDPTADTRSVVRLHPARGGCSYQGAGLRKVSDNEQLYADFALRDGSWTEREIAGRRSVGFVGEFREGKRSFIQHWTYVESGAYCVEFDFKVAADRFDEYLADIEAIVESYDGPRTPASEPVAPAADHPVNAKVRQTITDFHLAASTADLEGYTAHLSPELVFLGTDRTERHGRRELLARAEEYFSRGVGWVAEPVEQNVFVSEAGDLAWFDERLKSPSLGELRATGVLRLERETWRIVQYNVTFPVPNHLVRDLVDEIVAVDPSVTEHAADFSRVPEVDADDPAREVKQALREFHLAASRADAGRYFAHLADDGVYFGTDRSERFNKAELWAFLGPYLESGAGWTSVPFDQNVFFSDDGRHAWFDQRLAREGIGEMRSTGVLREEGGRWKIVQHNVSLPVPNELTGQLASRIREFYGPG